MKFRVLSAQQIWSIVEAEDVMLDEVGTVVFYHHHNKGRTGDNLAAMFFRPDTVLNDECGLGGPEITGLLPGWQQLQADVKLILEAALADQATLNRLASSVAAVGTAIAAVSESVRNHPATPADDTGQLTVMADQLDQAAQELTGIATAISADTAAAGGAAPAGGADTGGGAPAGDTTQQDPNAQPVDPAVDPNAPPVDPNAQPTG